MKRLRVLLLALWLLGIASWAIGDIISTGAGTSTVTNPQFNSVGIGVAASGTAGSITDNEGTAPLGSANNDLLYADSTAHRWKMNNNNVGSAAVGGVIASGTSALGIAAIAAGACAATVTTAATGVLSTDAIEWSHNAAVAGGTNGSLIIHSFPTAGNVNFQECNPTAAAITPPADTLNWAVVR